MRLSGLIPAPARPWASWLRQLPFLYRVSAGPKGYWTLARVSRPGDLSASCNVERVRVRALDGVEVALRPGVVDTHVAVTTFHGRYHLPPRHVRAPRLIWDLGANIGLTMAHMAHLFPSARVVGLEMDPANAALARKNVAPWDIRCEVVEAAAWTTDGTVRFRGEPGRNDGARVSAQGRQVAPALSLNTLLGMTGPPDFVKMDVEGAEEALLSHNTEWASATRCIAVECHPPYTLGHCRGDLESLGFSVRAFPQSWRRRARDCAIGDR